MRHNSKRIIFNSVGCWIVVLRLGMGNEAAESMFGETVASYMTMAGIAIFYTGYGLGMAQVDKLYVCDKPV